MAQITLDIGDPAELAEMLAFLADYLSGSQQPVLGNSLAAYVGHPAYNLDDLRADLHRVSLSCSARPTANDSSATRPDDHHHRRRAPA